MAIGGLVLAEVLTSAGGQRPRPAPELPTQVLVGPRTRLADLRGRPSLVSFWASWCGPCRREAAAVARFANRVRGRARVVGVDYTDSLTSARSFVERYHWTFPNLRDGDGATGDRYRVVGLPTTFVLDSRGRIVAVLTGEQTESKLEQGLRHATPSGAST